MVIEQTETPEVSGLEAALTCIRAKISALGTYVPPKLLTNADLERIVDTSEDWILARTGIRERHIAEEGVATSDLAARAACNALVQRGIGPEEVEAVLVGTSTPDMLFPSTACLVQDKLGARNAWGFDVSAGCSGFLFALRTGTHFIGSGAHRKVLIIGADKLSSVTDYTDRKSCVLFGDGAGAVLLEAAEATDEAGLIDVECWIDGSGAPFLNMPAGGSLHPSSHDTVDCKMHYLHQDGQAVFKYAVRAMAEACERILARNNLHPKDIDCFIPYQANLRIATATMSRLGIAPENTVINIDRYGNTASASIPLALETAIHNGKLENGALVMLASAGAGFTAGAALLRWAF